MFFHELIQSNTDRQRFEDVCAEFSSFFENCNRCLIDAYDIVDSVAASRGEGHHCSVLMLVRHTIESLDGVAILVSKSGCHPCQPLLRSALEAVLGVLYILESDSKRRALAYQVAYAHKKIKLYERLDPTTEVGRQLRRHLDGDALEEVFSALPSINYAKAIGNLQSMLSQPDFQPIETEWQRMKSAHPRKKAPAWHSLFGGPKSVEALAVHLRMAGMYEFLYRMWSESVHAGMAMEALGRKGTTIVIRPIRHPEQIQSAVQHAAYFSLILAQQLVEAYDPEKWPKLQERHKEKIDRRMREIAEYQNNLAPWKDSVF